jgi:C-terminal processing protease CtpA/Prc
MKRLLTLLLSSLALTATCLAQFPTAIENAGFEKGSPGQAPPGWFVPQPVLDAGYVARTSGDDPKEGKQCAYVTLTRAQSDGFGNVMQAIDATPYRGKMVRFRAAVKFDAGNGFGRAQLWLRIDRAGGVQGFFNNMGDRPITSPTWAFYDIVGDVASDAESINFGMMLVGTGKAWIDAATIGSPDGKDAPPAGSSKPLSARGLDNLVAYSKLLGYIRHFHPSNAVAKADWNAVAIAGVPEIEDAKDPAELALKLEAFFKPYAPTVRVFPTGRRPAANPGLAMPADTAALQIATWEHVGFGGGNTPARQNIYRSRRTFVDAAGGKIPAGVPDPRTPFEADLGGGVSCVVPLALFADSDSALPHTVDPKTLAAPPANATGDDRSTRLADTALAWNVYEHFYPYFDVVKTDWQAVLRDSLKAAATDADQRAFLDTLRRMVGLARDGHGFVGGASDDAFALPPFAADWVEGKLIVTEVGAGTTKPRVGDEILKINGKRVDDLWKALEPTISGATPQWRLYRGKTAILAGAPGSSVELEAARGTGDSYTVTLQRAMDNRVVEKRPDAIKEIKPGIWYVDLDGSRAKMEDFKKALPELAKAKGIVFDMRGYPNDVAKDAIERISDQAITSALWNVPKLTKPDRAGIDFQQSRWPLAGPLEPRLKAKIAFITDGRAISYAESIMGMVEAYKLGEIVGEPTAGTNGNINPFSLPGGYTVIFTGMKVLKHDGTTHHGIGIQPTIPTHRTIAGVMAKKDELLEKAISVVGG